VKRPVPTILAYALLAAVLWLALGLAGCAERGTQEDAASLHITVSIVPQEYFVQRIAGERADVTVMTPPGANPHTYEPRPEQMRALARSDAYLLIGVGFEHVWIERIRDANPDMLVVDTATGIEPLTMEAHSHDDEEDEHEEEHDEELLDPHIWLSPRLVAMQAEAIYEALAETDPQHEAEYAANLETFLADIEALDAEIRQVLQGIDSRKFIVFHPSWGYFAADYGLEQIPIEVDGTEPSAADLSRVISLAREENIRVILAQPEFSTQAAETIAQEIGGRVELVSPLAADWMENMRTVARTFAEVLGE
jgi:zinc transport system substrate-binding protein